MRPSDPDAPTSTAPNEAAADRELLVLSGMLDPVYYRASAGLGADEDPATHYLSSGWLQGLSPRPEFDPAFLAPHYAAARRLGPPALTWLALSVLPGRVPPRNATEASWAADALRTSPHFMAVGYARRIPNGLDPLTHYVVIGESLGWSPSPQLDPGFYLERHPDVAGLNLSPLGHYTAMGEREGRKAVPAVARLAFPALPQDGRPCVMLLVHDASRTGAPILGWNLIEGLRNKYNIVTVMMQGGLLESAFHAASDAAIGPLTLEDWHPSEFERLADRLVNAYDPMFVIANSVETSALIPSLGRRSIPVVALIHEFVGYVRPISKLSDMLSWATHVVFPAKIVATAAGRAFPALQHRRGVHVVSQGRPVVPGANAAANTSSMPELMHGSAYPVFTVLGLGTVQLRKGVDLFIAAATVAVQIMPSTRFRFLWIGGGYDPVGDTAYSVYLAAQIMHAGLDNVVEIIGELDDLAPAYACADVFLLSSRLDPQPNVAIEAIMLGVPTICFDGASGIADILATDPSTRCLVVPHLDAHAAAEVICQLAADPARLGTIRCHIARVGSNSFDMRSYVGYIERLGQDAASHARSGDPYELAATGAVDAELALPPGTMPATLTTAERQVLQQWLVVGLSEDQDYNKEFRRPCPGFHPQAYAAAHPGCGTVDRNPLLHWLEAGRPAGAWSHRVLFGALAEQTKRPISAVAVHAFLRRASSVVELREALAANQAENHLFLVVPTEGMARQAQAVLSDRPDHLRLHIAEYADPLDALLNGLLPTIEANAFLGVLHVHDDLDPSLDDQACALQRRFLWDNLMGPDTPMIDKSLNLLDGEPSIGLLMAEHPRLDGWLGTRSSAEALIQHLTPQPVLPRFFDYPRGGMFLARPGVLEAARKLATSSCEVMPSQDKYSAMLRLLPIIAEAKGFRTAGLRVPGTTC